MRRLAGEALSLIAALAALRLWKARRDGWDRLGRTMGGNTDGGEQGVAAFACGALLVPCGLDRLGDSRVSGLAGCYSAKAGPMSVPFVGTPCRACR